MSSQNPQRRHHHPLWGHFPGPLGQSLRYHTRIRKALAPSDSHLAWLPYPGKRAKRVPDQGPTLVPSHVAGQDIYLLSESCLCPFQPDSRHVPYAFEPPSPNPATSPWQRPTVLQ